MLIRFPTILQATSRKVAVDTIFITAATTSIGALASVIAYLWKEIKRLQAKHDNEFGLLQREHTKCQVSVAELRAEARRLAGIIEQVVGEVGDAAVITADAASGQIVEWNEIATVMFHWEKKQALGKLITILVPARYRDKHLEGWKRVVASGESPMEGPFHFEARTKDGTEVPVSVRLSGYRDNETGLRRISARIRPRLWNGNNSHANGSDR